MRRRKPRRSPYFQAAIDGYRAAREDFETYVLQRYLLAEKDCRGHLLNPRGERAKIDAQSLFYGPYVRVAAYASPELIEWFSENGRLTFGEYERQHYEAAVLTMQPGDLIPDYSGGVPEVEGDTPEMHEGLRA